MGKRGKDREEEEKWGGGGEIRRKVVKGGKGENRPMRLTRPTNQSFQL